MNRLCFLQCCQWSHHCTASRHITCLAHAVSDILHASRMLADSCTTLLLTDCAYYAVQHGGLHYPCECRMYSDPALHIPQDQLHLVVSTSSIVTCSVGLHAYSTACEQERPRKRPDGSAVSNYWHSTNLHLGIDGTPIVPLQCHLHCAKYAHLPVECQQPQLQTCSPAPH